MTISHPDGIGGHISVLGPSPLRNIDQRTTTNRVSARETPSPLHTDDDRQLYQSAQQLEGVFVQQMYKAMRETVPTDALLPTSGGEEMFTGLLDEHLAADTPQQWNASLSDAIYRHLRSVAHPSSRS